MQDRHRRIVEIFLLRTAGPYIRVIRDRSSRFCLPVQRLTTSICSLLLIT